ncbi:glycosyltransferase family 2 protein [Microbacterium gorillae]|uniref:glycosyltransferase family 2 protein n=1 Tax=Microbacterium gorillae TaxID=1231063 RepID=UPI00058ED392|nr:glycosyltransferase [Microbacterium gorillae]
MTRSLVIAIPTLRRPALLDRLLSALPSQLDALSAQHDVSGRVIVLDNDPDASAAEVAQRHGVQCVAVPAPGLAAVRNAALDAATVDDALVFIDDDEVPADGWLAALTGPWVRGEAEVVSGRVESTFPHADPWIEAGGFFRRVRFDAGAAMPFAATNNLLLDVAAVRASGVRFDAKFGLSGGEDIDLTRRLVSGGARIVSCPDALVYDVVPADRMTRAWVLRRAFRVGTTAVRGQVATATGARAIAVRLRGAGVGAARVGAGLARRAWGLVRRDITHDARGARLTARGAGMVAGALGVTYREYRGRHTVHHI